MYQVNQNDNNITFISHISYNTGPIVSWTLTLDNASIVSHQSALGVTCCDVIFAIGCYLVYSKLCVFLNYSFVYQHIQTFHASNESRISQLLNDINCVIFLENLIYEKSSRIQKGYV